MNTHIPPGQMKSRRTVEHEGFMKNMENTQTKSPAVEEYKNMRLMKIPFLINY